MRETPDLSVAQWVKSTYSNGEGGACLVWAPACIATPGVVPVRDSKDPQGPALLLGSAAFAAFVGAVRTGALRS
ncbi:DUF397 domain-containing protein [Streptomyces sp. NPDC087420]|uniref:DUF397 domain-containing protein n=1 Tax=Streptomyces sp. NPDC087420 TaxID=3365785 RepID=UPI0038391F0A